MQKMMIVLALCLFLVPGKTALGRVVMSGASEGIAFNVEEVKDGFGVVWAMAFLSDDDLLFTERSGKVNRLNLQDGTVTALSGVPEVWSRGQGGMLDVAVPPDYDGGQWIYFTYSKPVDGMGATTLARARLEGPRFADWQDLIVTRSATETGRHFGSRIVFDGQGHLFFSVGDRGVRPNGQDLSTHAGSILRLNRDGTAPEDNPFVGKAGLDEIWSYGHRNPQGLFLDGATGILWSIEHGPRGGDEINIIRRGGNYGWPEVSRGKEYWGPVSVGEADSKPGMIDPVKVYIPSIAPGSLLVYSGKVFPGWRGNLFSGALALTHLNRMVFDENHMPVEEERLLVELDERIRDVVESPNGWIYISTDSGRILRIIPQAGNT